MKKIIVTSDNEDSLTFECDGIKIPILDLDLIKSRKQLAAVIEFALDLIRDKLNDKKKQRI